MPTLEQIKVRRAVGDLLWVTGLDLASLNLVTCSWVLILGLTPTSPGMVPDSSLKEEQFL